MVVFDTTTLMLLWRPDARIPGAAGKPIPMAKERVEELLRSLEKTSTRIAVPTPALAELLVRVDPQGAQKIVEYLNDSPAFVIESFDQRAAIELAAMSREVPRGGNKKADEKVTWAKVKFDRQIVAIAKVIRATAIYSNDGDIVSLAASAGITLVGVHELPVPPESAQMDAFSQPGPEK